MRESLGDSELHVPKPLEAVLLGDVFRDSKNVSGLARAVWDGNLRHAQDAPPLRRVEHLARDSDDLAGLDDLPIRVHESGGLRFRHEIVDVLAHLGTAEPELTDLIV